MSGGRTGYTPADIYKSKFLPSLFVLEILQCRLVLVLYRTYARSIVVLKVTAAHAYIRVKIFIT
jgi:hypothetical protein